MPLRFRSLEVRLVFESIFLLTFMEGADVSNTKLSFDGGPGISIPRAIRDGEQVRVSSEGIVVYSSSWHELARYALTTPLPDLQPGWHQLEITSDLPGIRAGELKVEVRMTGAPHTLSGKNR